LNEEILLSQFEKLKRTGVVDVNMDSDVDDSVEVNE
jgi:hypothetical protein